MHEELKEGFFQVSLAWGKLLVQALFALVLSGVLRVLLYGILLRRRAEEKPEGPARPVRHRRVAPGRAFAEEVPVPDDPEDGLQAGLARRALIRPGVEN